MRSTNVIQGIAAEIVTAVGSHTLDL